MYYFDVNLLQLKFIPILLHFTPSFTIFLFLFQIFFENFNINRQSNIANYA